MATRDGERATFEAVRTGPRAARSFAEEVLLRAGAPAGVVRDFMLVVSELMTNFVEHSDGSSVELIIDTADPEWWDLEMIGGAGDTDKRVPQPHTWALAADAEISGRGLGIVRRLMDDLTVDVGRRRVSVCCRRRRDVAV